MKNIFLTGKIKVGKSTIITNVLDNLQPNKIEGFKTLPSLKDGALHAFIMQSLDPGIPSPNPPYIGRQIDTNRWTAVTETFEQFGVKILEHCLNIPPDLILMDELGFFESKAPIFQDRVFQCLSSAIPVLGVIKPVSTAFLNKIRTRTDVLILPVDTKNRNQRTIELTQLVKEVLS